MNAHILVVDDNDKMRMLLAERLRYAGYRVTQASDGETAIELLEHDIFDVVLTDIVMGEVGGIDVLHTARRQPYQPEVILLTGHGSLETAMAAVNEGAYKYLLKPCSPEEILTCVAAAVQQQSSEQELRQAARTLFTHLHRHNPAEPLARQPVPEPQVIPSPPPQTPARLRLGPLVIGADRKNVTLHGRAIRLTPIEYALLCCLAEKPGEPQRYRDIVRCSHHLDVDDEEAQSMLKSHVRNLRAKLGNACIVTNRGIGYTLMNPEE